MSYDAGTAFLQVVPSFAGVVDAITEEFSKDGEIAGQAFKETFETATRGLSATVGLETRPADERLAELKAEIDSLHKSVGVDISDSAALAKVAFLKAELDSLRGSIDLETGGGLAAELDAIAKAADDASGGGGGGGLAGLASSAGEAGAGISPMIPVLGLLATALIPIAGLAGGALATLPAIFAGLGTGVGALYLGISGILPAISAYQATLNTTGKTAAQVTTLHNQLANAMAGLTPAGQTFVAFVATQLLPVFSGLKSAVQGALLPGLASGLQAMLPFFQAIVPFIEQAATGIGNLFHMFGEFLGSAQGLKETNAIFSAGASFMQQLGQGALTLFGAIMSGGSQAGPILKAIGDGVVNIVNAFAKWVEGGGFQKFLAWLRQNGPGIVADISAVVKGVGALIVALAPVGLVMLKVIGFFGQLVSWMVKTPGVMEAVTIALGALGIALAVAMDTNPVGLIITAIALLVIGIIELITHWSQVWGEIKRIANEAWQWLDGNVFQPLVNFFTVSVPHAFDIVIGFFTSLPGRIGGALGGLFNTITGAFGDVGSWVNSNIIQPVAGFFTALPGDIYNAIKAGVGSALGIAKSIVNGLIGLVNDAIDIYDSHRPSLFGVSLLPAIPHIPTLHTGGIVPGPPGADVPTILQAGELVISRPDLAGLRAAAASSGDSGPRVSMPISVTAYDPRTAAVETFNRAGFFLKTRGF